VERIAGTAVSTSYPPYYAYPSAPPLQRALPKPPRLHWGWVLALTVLTMGIFASVWLLVQANWIRKMRYGKSKGFWLALANVLWLPLVFVLAFSIGVAAAVAPSSTIMSVKASLDPLVRMGSFILFLVTVFVMRSEMEADPIDMRLSGAMTFFFAVLYFQYHLTDYGGAYVAENGLGLTASEAHRAPDNLPIAYPPAAEVGVAYPPAVEPVRLPPEPPSV